MTVLDRYVRQMRFGPIGETGQEKICSSRALICGCGALGSVLANTLARAGVGHLRIVDRDFLELNNLQRQVLYDEDDVASGLPKSIAAANRLARINSEITIEPIVADVDHSNIADLVAGMDILLDGTDNFETRYLLNDAALKFNIPWVFGGCIGAEGQTMTVIPGKTPCFRCLMPEPPPPGSTPTCDSAGILSPIINIIASLQANEAIKILSGHPETVSPHLNVFELWDNRIRQIELDSLQSIDCPACKGSDYVWLNGKKGSHSAILCGRNAVQLSFAERRSLDLTALSKQLESVGQVSVNRYLLRLEIDKYQVTVFSDGRAIIKGTEDIAEAKTVYAKDVGH